ncbi:MAG TPA: M23 family metallopeptidase [Bacteroidales bacterium]
MAKKRKSQEKWYNKLRFKYRLVLFNDQTFEERFSFKLNRMNVILTMGSLAIFFIILTFFIIAYTPIKEYLPGYPDVDQRKELYKLNMIADSLLNDIRLKDQYLQNIKDVFDGKIHDSLGQEYDTVSLRYDTIKLKKSIEDSLLRAEFENQSMYNLYASEAPQVSEKYANVSIRNFNFFPPVNGIVTAQFNLKDRHYGTDLATKYNQAIKSTLEGTVIFSDWTLETGYVIAIQHPFNLISVYKHNSVLLKKPGDHVNVGEPIAISGQSGEYSTGPHLHFELWYNGTPINAEDYILFSR